MTKYAIPACEQDGLHMRGFCFFINAKDGMTPDDVVAAHYLHNKGVLKCVVLDPYPKTKEGLERKERLESLGVTVLKKMPPIAKYVFVGGALTLVADYIRIQLEQ